MASRARADFSPARSGVAATNENETMGSAMSFMRRSILLVLAIAAVGWLAAYATGIAKLTQREESHLPNNQGGSVTCRYASATGGYKIIDYTEHPAAVACAPYVSVWSRPTSGDHWAASIIREPSAVIECRFLRVPAGADNDLAARYTADAPLRLKIDLAARELTPIADDDRRALGVPPIDGAPSPAPHRFAWVETSHGAVLVLTGPPPTDLTLTIFADDGRASLSLSGPHPWERDGGCRPSA
jgi:hypothetical protein